jgi:aryl-alcohol dehydrogenase-like predicted oxidoreductase
MERRRLGSSDRTIAVIGVGGKGLTGARRGVEPADVQRAIAAAIEAGGELVDLSAPGSAGDAERRVGDELRALRARDRVVVATAAAGTGGRPPAPGPLQAAVEASLRALRVDAVPLCQLAGWRDAWLDDRGWPELRGALARLVGEGKVLAWGAIAPDDELPARALAEPWLASVQIRYSLFDRRADEAFLPAAAAARVGVIAREPLAGGGLAGDLGPGTTFPPGDERRAWPGARWLALPPAHARLAALVSRTPPVAAATDDGRALLDGLRRGPDLAEATVAELALRFAVAHPAITAAIPGARTPGHAIANLACADGRPLPARVKAALDDRAWAPGWYGLDAAASKGVR